MYFLVDANNLAGELRLLKQNNFDDVLIRKLAEYYKIKNKKIIAVFDARDDFGDKFTTDGITIEYISRRGYYKNADDRIVELSEKYLQKSTEEVVVVTNDRELRERIKILGLNYKKEIKTAKCREFIDYFERSQVEDETDNQNDELGQKDKNEIDKEFFNLWARKKP